MKIELPVLGIVNLGQEVSSDYKFNINKWNHSFEGTPIDIDVNFKVKNELEIERARNFLDKLSEIHKTSLAAIHKEYKDGEIVKEYIEEWNEDGFTEIFDENEFKRFIANTDNNKRIEEIL